MQWNRGYHDDDWRSRWRDRGRRRLSEVVEEFGDLAVEAGLWIAGCLAVASLAPAVLAAVLLRELLLMAAFVVSIVGLWHEENITIERFNRQDVALALLALGLVAGLFADPAAVERFVQAQAAGAGAA